MGVCDICASPGEGTHLAASQVREAVLDNGFDPFARKLFPKVTPIGYFEHWKNTVVAPDTSDWNLCDRCFAAIRPYFNGDPAPLEVHESYVPISVPIRPNPGYVPGKDPMIDMMIAPIVEAQKQAEERKKRKDDAAGCFVVILLAAASFGFHLKYQWGFWASLGAGFAATLAVSLVGAFVLDLFSPKKKS